jgi:hypothetical protein
MNVERMCLNTSTCTVVQYGTVRHFLHDFDPPSDVITAEITREMAAKSILLILPNKTKYIFFGSIFANNRLVRLPHSRSSSTDFLTVAFLPSCKKGIDLVITVAF